MRWRFVDRIDEVTLGESIEGVKVAGMAEDYFADHFPGFPVVPGVIVIEALAQLCGKLIELSVYEERGFWPWPILSMVNKAKFRRFVKPGSSIRMRGEMLSLRDESAMLKVEAWVDDKRTTTAELTFVFNPNDLPGQQDIEAVERSEIKILWPGYEAFLQTSRKTTGEPGTP
ncbi:MAG: 3-hydroxyacyl-ACP dehydratase FabZ family protein [Myxococcota bacterium]